MSVMDHESVALAATPDGILSPLSPLCCVLQVSLDLQPVEGVHRVTRSCCGTMVRAVAPARCAQVWTGPACACATFFGPV